MNRGIGAGHLEARFGATAGDAGEAGDEFGRHKSDEEGLFSITDGGTQERSLGNDESARRKTAARGMASAICAREKVIGETRYHIAHTRSQASSEAHYTPLIKTLLGLYLSMYSLLSPTQYEVVDTIDST